MTAGLLRRTVLSAASLHRTATRSISTSPLVLQDSEELPKVGKEEFMKEWEAKAPPTLKAPNFASDWVAKQTGPEEAETKSTEIPKKLKLSLYMPHEIIMDSTEAKRLPSLPPLLIVP